MQKFDLLLELATNEDIDKIEKFCKVNEIEYSCTFRSFYKNGQLIRTKGDKVVSSYYFYIITTDEKFECLNFILNNRIKILSYDNILKNCIQCLTNSAIQEKKYIEEFSNYIEKINDIKILNSLYQYSDIMNYQQLNILNNQIKKLSNVDDFSNKNIKKLREQTGMNRKQFSDYFGIPYRTIEDWENGKSNCASYLYDALKMILEFERKIKY